MLDLEEVKKAAIQEILDSQERAFQQIAVDERKYEAEIDKSPYGHLFRQTEAYASIKQHVEDVRAELRREVQRTIANIEA